MTSGELIAWGFVMHNVADWLLQNDWMAVNKVRGLGLAAWVHGLIYGLCMWPIFGAVGGLALMLWHVAVDTRVPVDWLIRIMRKTDNQTVRLGVDQALHYLLIALIAGTG